MSLKSNIFEKAAILCAAFFIFMIPVAGAKENPESFESVKKAAGQLLVKKQKSEAIQLISSWIKNESNHSNLADANDLLIKISQTFSSKDAQDSYEGSLNATLETPKEAMKLVEGCLQLEPENLDCLVQKTRLAYREKNRSVADKTLVTIGEFAKNFGPYLWVDLFLQKDMPNSGFKDKVIVKKNYDKASEENFVLTILEIERSFQAKNFSKARSGVDYLEKNYPDFPENIYFKQRLDSDSVEEKPTSQIDANARYAAKCKSLTRSMARKFRYDFDLCQRGL